MPIFLKGVNTAHEMLYLRIMYLVILGIKISGMLDSSWFLAYRILYTVTYFLLLFTTTTNEIEGFHSKPNTIRGLHFYYFEFVINYYSIEKIGLFVTNIHKRFHLLETFNFELASEFKFQDFTEFQFQFSKRHNPSQGNISKGYPCYLFYKVLRKTVKCVFNQNLFYEVNIINYQQ